LTEQRAVKLPFWILSPSFVLLLTCLGGWVQECPCCNCKHH
jgi:hypothetical protein